MMIPHFGNCVAVVLFLLGDHLRGVSVTGIIMCGFLVRALCGQTILIRLMSYSYVADRLREAGVAEELWMRSMSRIQVAEGFGTVIGSLAGWAVQVLVSARVSFCAGSLVHVITVLLIVALMWDKVYRPPKVTQRVLERKFLQNYWQQLRVLCGFGSLAHLTDCTFPAVRAILSKNVEHAKFGKVSELNSPCL
nr:hypothetical protein BaRGS_025237 [Batillaria attramentaria]